MVKVSVPVIWSIIGGLAAVAAVVVFFGWGNATTGQLVYADPTRGDYVDLLLTLATLFLGAIGLAITLGALVIGLVALKTLREIKDEAANDARNAAAERVTEAMPTALEAVLISDTGHEILLNLAKNGALDSVLERVVGRIQSGDPDLSSFETE